MTESEKAKHLFDKYYHVLAQTDSELSEEILVSVYAKRFALIAVEEIISICLLEWDDVWCKYWVNVKEELLKL